VFEIASEVHGRHPTATELSLDPVPIGERSRKTVWELRQALISS